MKKLLLVIGIVVIIGGLLFINYRDIPTPKPSVHNPKIKALIDQQNYHKPSDAEIKAMLSDQEYAITQRSATEFSGTGRYLTNHDRGVYVDVVSGIPLFASYDKFDSGCGWPSFAKPIDDSLLIESKDTSFHMVRTAVSVALSGSHLGHVFEDGPSELGGLRYCINGYALKFIPYASFDKMGYGYLKILFDKN